MQRLQGDGMAFVHACGTIIRRELRGERIRMDTGCLVAYTEGISFDVMLVPGLKSMFFGKHNKSSCILSFMLILSRSNDNQICNTVSNLRDGLCFV